MSSSCPSAPTNVFEYGALSTDLVNLDPEKWGSNASAPPPPKPLLIASPTKKGEYPLLLFLHGFLLYNSFYSQLLQHMASHGFIVIAPQLYSLAGPDATEEIRAAAAVTNWLSEGVLSKLLPPQVCANLAKAAIAGHSRGGKAAFGLALETVVANAHTRLKFSALIGIDPVDGTDKGKQTPPPILTHVPKSFDLKMPVLVIGSGLGVLKRSFLFPACAPEGVNHENFFNECKGPAEYFVVQDYGHLDMLNDKTEGLRGKATHCLCKNGKCREPMRRFVGGAVIAFLKAYLEGDERDLVAIREGRHCLPVQLQRVEFLV